MNDKAKIAALRAAPPFCDLHKMPLARCGCMPTDDGPGQPGAVETEKKGTEDANAK